MTLRGTPEDGERRVVAARRPNPELQGCWKLWAGTTSIFRWRLGFSELRFARNSESVVWRRRVLDPAIAAMMLWAEAFGMGLGGRITASVEQLKSRTATN